MANIRLSRLSAVLAALACLAALSINANADINSDKRISKAVRAVRDAKTQRAAFEAAKRLADVVNKSDLASVHDITIQALPSLLETKNDGVRFWVASALACFGPRAKFAVPKLLEVLKESDCLRSDTSSSMPIRLALERIGVPVPPAQTCEHYN